MHIGELAIRVGVNPKTIRYYENIELIPRAQRASSGYRLYGEDDVQRLDFIRAAQRLGMRLDEIAGVLALREDNQRSCGYVSDVLHHHVADIDRRISQLQRLRRQLLDLHARADQLASDPDAAPAWCPLIDHVRHQDHEHG